MSKNLDNIYDHLIDVIYPKYRQIIKRIISYRRGSSIIKIRIIFFDDSFLDILWSETDRYSLHWERRHVNGSIYRHDNAPHWKNISTYPKHFHSGSEANVTESNLSENPIKAVIEFLQFIKGRLTG